MEKNKKIELSDLVEVRLKNVNGKDSFLQCVETLERIGIANKKDDKSTLFQSCHIFHKKRKYYITHFKEMYLLDGMDADFTEIDKSRRNTIANLLDTWGLIEIVDKDKTSDPVINISKINIIKAQDKKNWVLKPMYVMSYKKKERKNV